MSARSFDLLLESAYSPEVPELFEEGAPAVYKKFEQTFKATRLQHKGTSAEELNFRFELVRLGVAIAFIKAFSRLADNEGATEVLALLQEAVKAKSTREIDKIIQKKIAAFDTLYQEIFVHEQREQILGLFERTLDAASKDELDNLMLEGLDLLQTIDFDHNNPDEDEDDPIDDEFIKSIK
ncbi:hypothetical protein FVR03_04370 [Pontibacter qinzhouensis]|uniref:Uncharacterized protein n=1 Tax=Pontibacter qinzhouensis TaxID=2603253 RepID=A0A5C8KDF5_9BACT|nr:hypothetical protein [Pontibacter qinzhouensis]TXK50731.1 hypothetical protein FVR03_04370 [Pontibacter qinzhouensis]